MVSGARSLEQQPVRTVVGGTAGGNRTISSITLEDRGGDGTDLSWFENVVEGGYGARSLVGATERGQVMAVRCGGGRGGRRILGQAHRITVDTATSFSCAIGLGRYVRCIASESSPKESIKSPSPREVSPISSSRPRTSLHLASSLPSPPSSSSHPLCPSRDHLRSRSTPKPSRDSPPPSQRPFDAFPPPAAYEFDPKYDRGRSVPF